MATAHGHRLCLYLQVLNRSERGSHGALPLAERHFLPASWWSAKHHMPQGKRHLTFAVFPQGCLDVSQVLCTVEGCNAIMLPTMLCQATPVSHTWHILVCMSGFPLHTAGIAASSRSRTPKHGLMHVAVSGPQPSSGLERPLNQCDRFIGDICQACAVQPSLALAATASCLKFTCGIFSLGRPMQSCRHDHQVLYACSEALISKVVAGGCAVLTWPSAACRLLATLGCSQLHLLGMWPLLSCSTRPGSGAG